MIFLFQQSQEGFLILPKKLCKKQFLISFWMQGGKGGPTAFLTQRANQSHYIATFKVREGWVGQFS